MLKISQIQLKLGQNQSLEVGRLFIQQNVYRWAESSEFVSSSIPSWQTAHAQPFSGARDLAFCLKVPLFSLLVWASSGGSGETAQMRRLSWTFAARIGDKYQIRLARPRWQTEPYLSTFRNWGDSAQSKIFGYFFVRLSMRRKSLKILMGETFYKTKSRLNNKAFCFKR